MQGFELECTDFAFEGFNQNLVFVDTVYVMEEEPFRQLWRQINKHSDPDPPKVVRKSSFRHQSPRESDRGEITLRNQNKQEEPQISLQK